MKIKEQLIKMYPEKITDSELTALLRLAVAVKPGEDVLEIDNDELSKFLGFGRDKNDIVLNSLISKKLITRDQQKNEKGQFAYNQIRITTDLISI